MNEKKNTHTEKLVSCPKSHNRAQIQTQAVWFQNPCSSDHPKWNVSPLRAIVPSAPHEPMDPVQY